MTPLDEIRTLYFETGPATIDRDFARAVDLLKSMPEAERDRAAVYMEGLAEMRREFASRGPSRRTSARRGARPRGRSDRRRGS